MNHAPSITKEEIALLTTEVFQGEIIVVDTLEKVDHAIEKLSQAKTVGFDTETRPNFSKNSHHKIALMQIATDNCCYLFRLNLLHSIPAPLEDFLKDKRITKVGLSLQDDFLAIRQRSDIKPTNFVDLQKMVADYGIKELSLQKIYAILFEKKISKKMRLSNWNTETLSEAQQKYAALDAWSCLSIYNHLKKEVKQ